MGRLDIDYITREMRDTPKRKVNRSWIRKVLPCSQRGPVEVRAIPVDQLVLEEMVESLLRELTENLYPGKIVQMPDHLWEEAMGCWGQEAAPGSDHPSALSRQVARLLSYAEARRHRRPLTSYQY